MRWGWILVPAKLKIGPPYATCRHVKACEVSLKSRYANGLNVTVESGNGFPYVSGRVSLCVMCTGVVVKVTATEHDRA